MQSVTLPASSSAPAWPELRVAGKFFRRGEEKVFLRGVSYGPFAPNARGEPFPEDGQLQADLEDIKELGFNTVRLYELPTDAVLTRAEELGLSLLVNIPWTDHVDFLRTRGQMGEIEAKVVAAVRRLKGHASVAAFLVGHEIEKTLVRWMGPVKVQRFLERLIALGRAEAPSHLFSYSTYPSTEYLMPRTADFVAVNVYLEEPAKLAAYLQRLQNLAGNKPLVIAEFGLDVARHSEEVQAQTARWGFECVRQAGVAGQVWFSYTDDWFRGGKAVTDWQFGLVTADRQPRQVCALLQEKRNPLQEGGPRFSVVVCTRNGSATLRACLESLGRLRYPNREVILIDDGSTEDIVMIAKAFPFVRYQRQEAAGLSVARNLGAAMATGEVIAYTDDDCLVDEDWLTYLAEAFEDPQWVAAGGPNIPPPPRNRGEAVVAAAPGAPAHVLLNDMEAEHLPGCNFVVRKSALEAVGGFRAVFTTAGDDVDICWRLRAAGGRLRFVPAAMVWHHRRFTVRAYLRQQQGYGRAEALLMREHPENFGILGGARWHGAIYGDRLPTARPAEGCVFHGPLGQGLFQGVYVQGMNCWLDWLGGVAWIALALICILVGQFWLALVVVALASAFATCRLLNLPAYPFVLNAGDKALLWALCLLQPAAREWARLAGILRLRARPNWKPDLKEALAPGRPRKWATALGEMAFWSDKGLGREQWLNCFQSLLKSEHLAFRPDDGWRWFDVEMNPESLVSPAVISVTEYHGEGRCLTRVRLLLRLRWLLLAAVFGVLVLLVVTLLNLPKYLTLTLAAAFILLALSALLQRAALRRCVRRAAREAGLEPVKS